MQVVQIKQAIKKLTLYFNGLHEAGNNQITNRPQWARMKQMKNTTTHKAHLTTPYAIPTYSVIFYKKVGISRLKSIIAGAFNVGDIVQVIVCGRVNNYLIIRG